MLIYEGILIYCKGSMFRKSGIYPEWHGKIFLKGNDHEKMKV